MTKLGKKLIHAAKEVRAIVIRDYHGVDLCVIEGHIGNGERCNRCFAEIKDARLR